MKTRFVYAALILLCFFKQSVKAQAYIYHPMVVDSATWEYSQIKENNVFCEGDYKKLIFGDTIVDSKLYKKIQTPWNVAFDLIREENKKIYYRRGFSTSFKQELLLYDFSKSLGDTILTGDYNAQGTIDTLKSKIIKVDSIQTLKGYRKRFIVEALNYGWAASCGMPERFWFIEEIGSPILLLYIEFAILASDGPCEGSYYIVRKTNFRDTLVIPSNDCLHISIKENINESAIKTYYNTSTNTLNVSKQGVLVIYNMQGSKVFEKNIDSPKVLPLGEDLRGASGVYVWRLQTDKDVQRGKFVITE